MSNLQKTAEKLKQEVEKIADKIKEIERQINEKKAQRQAVLNGKVSREQFKGYLLKQFSQQADTFQQNLLKSLKMILPTSHALKTAK